MKPKQIAETGWRYLRISDPVSVPVCRQYYRGVTAVFRPAASLACCCFCAARTADCSGALGSARCTLLMKNMTMLFLPIGIGVMNYYDTLSAQLLPILIACVVSTFIAMCAVALSSEFIHRRHVPVPEQQEADAVAAAEHTEQQEKRKC